MKKKYFTEKERKQAKKETHKKWRRIHSKELKIIKKNYYQDNKEKILLKLKEHRQNNIEKYKMKDKIYSENNKEKIKVYQTQYRKKHRKESKNYEYNRYNFDIYFKLRKRLRQRIRQALHNNQKSGSAVKDLGCSISELKTYLESKFQDGMGWDNYGFYGWHIDHIKPLSSFDLSNREEFLKACHYTNLQPMWAEENMKKKDKLFFR